MGDAIIIILFFCSSCFGSQLYAQLTIPLNTTQLISKEIVNIISLILADDLVGSLLGSSKKNAALPSIKTYPYEYTEFVLKCRSYINMIEAVDNLDELNLYRRELVDYLEETVENTAFLAKEEKASIRSLIGKLEEMLIVLPVYMPTELFHDEIKIQESISWSIPHDAKPNCFSSEFNHSKMKELNFSLNTFQIAYYSKYDRYKLRFKVGDKSYFIKSTFSKFKESMPREYLNTCLFELQRRATNSEGSGTILIPLNAMEINYIFDQNNNKKLKLKCSWKEKSGFVKRLELSNISMSNEKYKLLQEKIKAAQKCCPAVL